MQQERADRHGEHRNAFARNSKKIIATQEVCGICGQPVDKTLRYPDPMAPSVDHIIPLSRGGHPSDISNLQLTHWICNRQKSDKLMKNTAGTKLDGNLIANRNLPQTRDWSTYQAAEE